MYYKHHGIYAYRNDFLQVFSRLPQGNLEKAERLEQLRALENGHRIKLVITDKDSVEVDTPADLERVRGNLCKDGLTNKKDRCYLLSSTCRYVTACPSVVSQRALG